MTATPPRLTPETRALLTHALLDREMRGVLLQLHVVSHGTTPSYNPSTSHAADTALMPPGEGSPEADHWREQYDLAETDTGRRAVITSAREDLERLKRRDPNATRGQSADELIQDMLTATEGWAPEDVERSSWRMTATIVRRHRVNDNRWPDSGQKVNPDKAADDGDPAGRAREMREKGMSVRQIALMLGKHKTQIERYLAKAA